MVIMDDTANKDAISSYNYELLQNFQGAQKSSVCKRFGFKKILFFLAVLQLLCIWYLYKANYWKVSSRAKESDLITDDYDQTKAGLTIPNAIFHLPLTRPTDMSKYYIPLSEDVSCMTTGMLNEDSTSEKCLCQDGWAGSDCGIPYSLWDSGFLQNGTAKGIKVQRRQQPRRIVHSIYFNGDFKRLREYLKLYFEIADLFLIGYFPNNSKLTFTELIEKHKLSFAARKIFFITLSENEVSSRNVAIVQYAIWKYAKTILSEVRPDDLLIMSDIYNQPSKDVLIFLKLYDGFGEPIFFYLKQVEPDENISNLSYTSSNSNQGFSLLSPDIAACHVEFLRLLCNYDARLVWLHKFLTDKPKILRYQASVKNTKFSPWNVGSPRTSAGIYSVEKLTKVSSTVNENIDFSRIFSNITS